MIVLPSRGSAAVDRVERVESGSLRAGSGREHPGDTKELEQEVQQGVARPIHLNSVTAVLARRQQYRPLLNDAYILRFGRARRGWPARVAKGRSGEGGPMNGPISVA